MAEGEFGSIVILKDGKYDYLVDHAIRNVWCNPDQDNQHIFKPQRASKSIGVLNRITIMKRSIEMPTSGVKYHVFQIGNLQPEVIGLLRDKSSVFGDGWVNFATAMNTKDLFVDLYVDRGLQIPRFQSWYMFTDENNLIIAIQEESKIAISYGTEDIYLRVYTNAYYSTSRANASTEYIRCFGLKVKNTSEILDAQNSISTNETFTHYSYVNGWLVDKIDLITVKIGDVIEFVQDTSIKHNTEFVLDSLRSYLNKQTEQRRFILARGDDNLTETIDYYDDIDLYLLYRQTNGRWRGLYMHRNDSSLIRMLTHCDYSLNVRLTSYFVTVLKDLDPTAVNTDQFVVYVRTRDSGYERPLVFENNRIQELYKLTYAQRMAALEGTNTSLDLWTASNLENSNYCNLMSLPAAEISNEIVSSAYGYNAISKLLGDSPLKVIEDGQRYVNVPHGCVNYATAYEYDSNGLLVDVVPHLSGSIYVPSHSETVLVEFFSGFGNYTPTVSFFSETITEPTAHEYRVYRATVSFSGIQSDWKDVTGTNYYSVVNGVITKNPADYNAYYMLRTDQRFLAYDLTLKSIHGCLKFTLSENVPYQGVMSNMVMLVPMGRLDIFLNKRILIEGVDYIVNFPEVIIFNKEYLNTPRASADQKIHIRFTGFCNSDLSRSKDGDIGWVKHGLLSENNRYDIRDDRVLQIVMKGGVYHRDSLFFSETDGSLGIMNSRNGYPYMIRDQVIPMKSYTERETYEFRKETQAIDDAVSGYLTSLLPEPTDRGLSAITKRYEIFSPFISKLLYDMEVKLITTADLSTLSSDNDILNFCKPYEEYLAFDPTQPENQLDSNFVVIHPNNDYKVIPLNIIQYRFIRRVVALYCNGLVDLSAFISMTEAV